MKGYGAHALIRGTQVKSRVVPSAKLSYAGGADDSRGPRRYMFLVVVKGHKERNG